MKDEYLTLFEAARDLITYIDKEHVFDKAGDMGCGGFDTTPRRMPKPAFLASS